jgi:hypothetical protein
MPGRPPLTEATFARAHRLLVFSYPPDTTVTRDGFWSENVMRRLRDSKFRTYVHSPTVLRAAAESDGHTVAFQHHGWD